MSTDTVAKEQENSTTSPTVFVVDNDPAVRKALGWLIESVHLDVETFESAYSFLDSYDPQTPGCLILDNRMPGMTGLELQEKLRNSGDEIPIILISAFADVPITVRAMKNGAVYVLEKPANGQVLLELVHGAIEQDRQNRERRLQVQIIEQRYRGLSAREQEVVQLVVEGQTSKQIAGVLGVKPRTVEAHRANIMMKMDAKSVPELVQMMFLLDSNGRLDAGRDNRG